jgi:hypothetical protein
MSAAIVLVMGFCWAVLVAADKADLLDVENDVDVLSGAIIRYASKSRAFSHQWRGGSALFSRDHKHFDALHQFMYNPLFPESRARNTPDPCGIFSTINEVSNHVRGHKNRWQAV